MGHENDGSAATNDEGKTANNRSIPQSPPGAHGADPTVDETTRAVRDLRTGVGPSAPSQSGIQSPPLEEDSRPPLPPRPGTLDLFQEGKHSPGNSLQRPKKSNRPNLQSTATTALSRTDIQTQSYQDGSRETYAASAETTLPSKSAGVFGSIRRFKGIGGSETGDSASVRSYAPTLEAGGDGESLLGEVLGASQSPSWKLLSTQYEAPDPFDSATYENDEATVDFYREFDEIRAVDKDGGSEGATI